MNILRNLTGALALLLTFGLVSSFASPTPVDDPCPLPQNADQCEWNEDVQSVPAECASGVWQTCSCPPSSTQCCTHTHPALSWKRCTRDGGFKIGSRLPEFYNGTIQLCTTGSCQQCVEDFNKECSHYECDCRTAACS